MPVEQWNVRIKGWFRKGGRLVLARWNHSKKTQQLRKYQSQKLKKTAAMASEELQKSFDDAEKSLYRLQKQPVTFSPHERREVVFQAIGPSFAERVTKVRLGNTNEALGSHPARQPPLQPFQYRFRETGGRGVADLSGEPQENWSTQRNPSTSIGRCIPMASRSTDLFYLQEETDTDTDTDTDMDTKILGLGKSDLYQPEYYRTQRKLSSLRIKHDQLRGELSQLQETVNNVKWIIEEMKGLPPDGRISNYKMIKEVEGMRNRILCYEDWIPTLCGLFEQADEAEIAQLEAQAKAASENRTKLRSPKMLTNAQRGLAYHERGGRLGRKDSMRHIERG